MKITPEQIGPQSLKPMAKTIQKGLDESLDARKHRLRKATKEFESFFMLHMLKAMRKTIPKSDLLDNSLGQDIYTSMFDEELARKVSGSSPNSLSEMLYRSLEKNLEATAKGQVDGKEIKGNIPTSIEEAKRVQASPIKQAKSTPLKTDIEDKKVQEPQISTNQVTQPKPKITADPILKEYGATIDKASKKYDVDSRLIYSVIVAESGGDPDAVSSRGAKGLMQLIDSTAAELGVADSLDPHQNIIGGTKYLRQLLDRYNGSMKLALAAYNAGPGNVLKYNGVPPYPETHRYIENVLERLHSVKKP